MVCLRRMDALKERLAEADSQYSDLVDELETARNNLFEEEDADKKADLRMVYEDVTSMVDKTGTRVVQLEAALYGNGKLTLMSSECTFKDCFLCRCVLSDQPTMLPHTMLVVLLEALPQLLRLIFVQHLNCSCVLLLCSFVLACCNQLS